MFNMKNVHEVQVKNLDLEIEQLAEKAEDLQYQRDELENQIFQFEDTLESIVMRISELKGQTSQESAL